MRVGNLSSRSHGRRDSPASALRSCPGYEYRTLAVALVPTPSRELPATLLSFRRSVRRAGRTTRTLRHRREPVKPCRSQPVFGPCSGPVVGPWEHPGTYHALCHLLLTIAPVQESHARGNALRFAGQVEAGLCLRRWEQVSGHSLGLAEQRTRIEALALAGLL